MGCAQGRNVTALYALHEGEYVPYILGAPDFVNRPFVGLHPRRCPGPHGADREQRRAGDPRPGRDARDRAVRGLPAGRDRRWLQPRALQRGSVDDLAACASSLGVTSAYALVDGEYVPYILGAPAFVSRPFLELFADGVPALTPLVVRGE